MNILAAVPLPVWITVVPAVLLLTFGIAYQPRHLFPPKHFTGVRATRPARMLLDRFEAEREAIAEYERKHPQPRRSPAWTVQPREVTPA